MLNLGTTHAWLMTGENSCVYNPSGDASTVGRYQLWIPPQAAMSTLKFVSRMPKTSFPYLGEHRSAGEVRDINTEKTLAQGLRYPGSRSNKDFDHVRLNYVYLRRLSGMSPNKPIMTSVDRSMQTLLEEVRGSVHFPYSPNTARREMAWRCHVPALRRRLSSTIVVKI